MNQPNTHILILIKLLEGHLSDAEGLSVREQLASDSILLQRWKTLSQVYEQQISPEFKGGEHVVTIDAESIAAFVEERMSPEQRSEFESECWNHTEVLSEVISAYQAVQSDVSTSSISEQYTLYSAPISKQMNVAVEEHCQSLDSLTDNCRYLQIIKDSSQSDPDSSPPDSSDADVESVQCIPRIIDSNRKSNSAKKRILQRYSRFYIAMAVVVVVIAIPIYMGFIQDRGNSLITKNPVLKSLPSMHKNPRPNPKQILDSEPVPKLAVVPEIKPKVDFPNPSPKVVPVPPVMNNQGDQKPVVAKKGMAADSVAKLDLQVDWVQMSGIIGVRSTDSIPWKGILTEASSNQISNEKHLELRTLPFSWLQGIIKSKSGGVGPEFVLGANSEIQFMIRGAKTEKRAKQVDAISNSPQTVIDLNLIAGKVAFSKLKAGDELQFQDQRQSWLIQVKQSGTSIGFIQLNENKREIIVFSGEVQITSRASHRAISLNSDQMIVMRNHSFGAPLKVVGKQSWRTEPPKLLKLSTSFIEQMNQSDDLVSALLSLPPDKVGVELLASTNLGFALDPVTTVSQAAFSKSETQRTAAIAWLIAAKEDPTTNVVWNKINVASNAGPGTPSIRNWFNIARGKAPRNQKTLAELSAGLGVSQPLFVRQCSIHFLRQITRQRLAEYDPNQPTTAAINSVRQKVRRATLNTRPKNNTRSQGNNKKRRK
ncbi:MAG: hypothetical protein QM501_00890 [Gimesia sp.]